ncbi:MAG TPA: alpha/beta hydrolase [Phnomibacter sp.]|nr:alpha/beta hydrolase [Phnomibacter sp.]
MKFSYLAAIIQLFITLPASAQHNDISHPTSADAIINNRISEEQFIEINELKQWVTIKGDRSKPVILFLHGGPGSTMSPYAEHIYKEWEKDFVIVQWDQRGAGRTYEQQQAPEELTPEYLQTHPLTIEQMAADGIALSEYLLQHLKKKKLILFGTSWGSALGATIATKRPDLFYAYVGHSQIVNPNDDLSLYNKVYQRAINNNDKQSLDLLNTIGKPPHEQAKTVGQLWRIVKKYERESSVAAPEFWFVESPGYNNAKDDQSRRDGDDYSFVNFVGDKRLGVAAMRTSINFLANNLEFKIPVYFIQGEEDILTPKETTKMYFDQLTAPIKKYFLLPKTAHEFNQSVVDTQYEIFKAIKAF